MNKAVEFLQKRIEWLEKERRNGGDYKHLTTRMEESQYILGRIAPLLKQPSLEAIIAKIEGEKVEENGYTDNFTQRDVECFFMGCESGKNNGLDKAISIIQEFQTNQQKGN